MSELIPVVRDVCSAMVAGALAAKVPGIKQISAATPEGEAAWAAATVKVNDDIGVLASSLPPPHGARLLGIGPFEPANAAVGLHLQLRVAGNPGYDPVHWAILCDAPVMETILWRGRRRLASTTHRPSGGYSMIVLGVAEAAIELLEEATAREIETPHAVDPAPPVRVTTMVDWDRPARQIARMVVACDAPGLGAWTYWDGLKVRVGPVEPLTAEVLPVPAGSVIALLPEGLRVQAGDGWVIVKSLSDPIGPIDLNSVAIGSVLGIDWHEKAMELVARVAELELVVGRLASPRHLL